MFITVTRKLFEIQDDDLGGPRENEQDEKPVGRVPSGFDILSGLWRRQVEPALRRPTPRFKISKVGCC